MEYPLAILAPLSACYLLHSYWTPSFAPNGVTKLVQYKYLASANEVSALTVSGGCYIGEEKVPCCTLDLGTCLTKLKPWLAVFPICQYPAWTHGQQQLICAVYGLVLLGTIFVLLYAAAAKRTSTNRERLAELRTFVLVVLVLATLAGVAGTVGSVIQSCGHAEQFQAVGCVLLLLPLLDANLSEVIYVDAG
jgi:hypothetical protein